MIKNMKKFSELCATPYYRRSYFFGSNARLYSTIAKGQSFPFLFGEIVSEPRKNDYRVIGQSPHANTAVIAQSLTKAEIQALQMIENEGTALTIGILNADAGEDRLQEYRQSFKSEVVAIHPESAKKADLSITQTLLVRFDRDKVLDVVNLADANESSYRFD